MAMGRRKRTRTWPAHMRSIDGMIAQDVPVFASCSVCDTVTKVDLEELKRKNGGNGSLCLINKKGQCKTEGCVGKVAFLYKRGEGLPLFGLMDYGMMG